MRGPFEQSDLRYNRASKSDESLRMENKLFFQNARTEFSREVSDPIAERLLPEYGAVFVARGGVTAPDRMVFKDEREVEEFQRSIEIGSVEFGDIKIELQKTAAEALTEAVKADAASGLSITPRSADSGRRYYADTVELWHSRVEPALVHWTSRGNISLDEADQIRGLSPFEQVPIVFKLEERQLWFSKDLSKSIIYSVAPPGTSQHLSMLAFDASEFGDASVRELLGRYYWYQTVISDLPHFTYLGVPEAELSDLGLKKMVYFDRHFWVPDL